MSLKAILWEKIDRKYIDFRNCKTEFKIMNNGAIFLEILDYISKVNIDYGRTGYMIKLNKEYLPVFFYVEVSTIHIEG